MAERTAPLYPLRKYRVEVTYRESAHAAPPHAQPGPFRHQLAVTARDETEAGTMARDEFAHLVLHAERVCLVENAEVVANSGIVCWQCAACGAVVAEPRTHCCPPPKPKAGPDDITQELPIPKR